MSGRCSWPRASCPGGRRSWHASSSGSTTSSTSYHPHQKTIIAPFAEWSVVRDARRRAARGRYTTRASTHDRADIRVAIKFLTWLDANQLDLTAVNQEDIDLWLTTHPTPHRSIGSFIRWMVTRRLTGQLTILTRRPGLPSRFLGD
ncbi:hypothetical protein [Kribbella sp. VKM Ac-2566]|uniref:hypothetical protein n=1 Tax=Kribbella sp. VKM Ac-2566 TaxID=2512218 RepID=UPI001063F2B0|nr:hypothetical protein [Kribbella sp. VKM Ac-2566]